MNAITNVCIRHNEYERLYKLIHVKLNETQKETKKNDKNPNLCNEVGSNPTL